ncbi:hypothetical protein E3O45_13080 [Cryobacterium sp. TMS1-20-1]|uniref:hypothetical protein n=1 Tax=Cryobacterium sp. TMS1-20-1 TaxID=1259223 RepID=UPI00106919A4|nr:hypothetical protein [Cryobacterium sp. TMS1-20-1]TFC72469.1 hypothetical protein E3O45_13080 [Cryobacterium sp. TMS1-20-1]
MSSRQPDPSGADPVARQRLNPDATDWPDVTDWDDERMRAARPRVIRLNPDGSRVHDATTERSEADTETPPPAS